MTTISGGYFNFTGYYTPPPLTSGIYNFTKNTPYILYQIYSLNNYIYAACSTGLNIFEINSNTKCSFINFENGFTTVAGNSNKLYVGTTSSGIKCLDITSVSGNITSPYDLTNHLYDFNTLNITSNSIKYIHTHNNKFTVCTSSGIDYYIKSTNPEIHSQTFISGAEKCFTTNKSLYYTISSTNNTNSGIEYSLNRVDTCLTDWIIPTQTYTTGSGIFEKNIKLTDLYITEGTAKNKGNTIFCTTTSGLYIIDEDNLNYTIFYTRGLNEFS